LVAFETRQPLLLSVLAIIIALGIFFIAGGH
jgi:hypothetical protein